MSRAGEAKSIYERAEEENKYANLQLIMYIATVVALIDREAFIILRESASEYKSIRMYNLLHLFSLINFRKLPIPSFLRLTRFVFEA